MKRIISICFLLCVFVINAQNIKDFSKVNIDALSDQEISSYLKEAEKQGKTMQELELMALMNGASQAQINKFRQRIVQLQNKARMSNQQLLTKGDEEKKNPAQQSFYPNNWIKEDSTAVKKSKVFGYDFFQNPNISFTPTINMPTPANYILSSGDELLVEVWGAVEMSAVQKIDNQGNININNIGKVRVGGLAFEEAKEKINTALRKIYAGIMAAEGSYNKVYTGVSLSEVKSISVSVIGEVQAPGTYTISGLSTLLSAIYASGGPTENGSYRGISLMRSGKRIARFDVYDFLLTGSQEGNVGLRQGDVIIVPPYSTNVEVCGEVKRPGIYQLKEGEKLSDLERFFGGYAPSAYTDNLVIERIEGSKRVVKEVQKNQYHDFEMKAGDKLRVHALSSVYQNKMSIAGAVYQPGSYAYTEGMTLLDLIERAAGVRDDAYLERGILFRTENRVDKKAINFSVKKILNKEEHFPLMANDSVHVFEKLAVVGKDKIRIAGAVRNPQEFEFMKGLYVEDLVVMSGGFAEGADATQIEVSRQLNDENFNKISELHMVSFTDDLKVSAGNIELLPNDIVNVRYKKGYGPQMMINIEGQVLYPGAYTLTSKNDRISDIIRRAGGFTPYAFVEGATLVRKKDDIAQEQEQQIKELEQIASTNNLKINTTERKEFRVGINLKEIMQNEKSLHNIFLREGDVLIVPSLSQTVEVKGAVLSPSLIRYEPHQSPLGYIRGAGGFAHTARKKSVYVMYANGQVESTRNFLLFKKYPKIKPGSVVIVPEKPEKQGMTTAETVSITTAFTTLAILIFNTFKK